MQYKFYLYPKLGFRLNPNPPQSMVLYTLLTQSLYVGAGPEYINGLNRLIVFFSFVVLIVRSHAAYILNYLLGNNIMFQYFTMEKVLCFIHLVCLLSFPRGFTHVNEIDNSWRNKTSGSSPNSRDIFLNKKLQNLL